MAISFAVRIVTFISSDWFDSPLLIPGNETYREEFKGDNRTFSKDPNASYRTAHQVNVTFTNDGASWKPYRKTGITELRTTNYKTGNVITQRKQASAEGLTTVEDSSSIRGASTDWYRFLCEGDAANPLMPGSPAINYQFYVYVSKAGQIRLEGMHDGFPSYEVYASVNGGTWQNIYLFTEKSLTNLGPPMDIKGVSVTRNII
ncbi:DUF3238 domain-containing protein [Paenibacillus sp. An7]|uniref:DUF3238 domain-containing protein n=1 Tax=Paenibacillus sp. An7 TaxID=2689577 RepID=UPI001356B114|nr:DUF3238 domain-containing protein [Paenibacillus sp. An7]